MSKIFAAARKKNPTKEEAKLAELLNSWEIAFEREKSIGNYIADFVIKGKALVIEVDGPYHFNHRQQAADSKKDNLLLKKGYSILRITNEDIDDSNVMNHLKRYIEKQPLRIDTKSGNKIGESVKHSSTSHKKKVARVTHKAKIPCTYPDEADINLFKDMLNTEKVASANEDPYFKDFVLLMGIERKKVSRLNRDQLLHLRVEIERVRDLLKSSKAKEYPQSVRYSLSGKVGAIHAALIRIGY